MAGPGDPASAAPAHDDSPPPQYSDVIRQDRADTRGQFSFKTPVLLSGLLLSLVLVIILGCLVGDLWVRLDTLQLRVEHRNEREIQIVKSELNTLKNEVGENNKHFKERIDHLVKRINGLQEAFKTGDVKYLVSEAQSLLSHVNIFLVAASLLILFLSHIL